MEQPMQSRVWLARTGEGGYALADCISAGVVALRYHTVGDARSLTREQIADALRLAKTRVNLGAVATMLVDFVHQVRVGDLIVTPHAATRSVYFAEITGEYRFADPSPVAGFLHLRAVHWFGVVDRDTDIPANQLAEMDRPPTFYELTGTWWPSAAARARAATSLVVPPPRLSGPGNGRASRPGVIASDICDACGLRKPASIIHEGVCADCR